MILGQRNQNRWITSVFRARGEKDIEDKMETEKKEKLQWVQLQYSSLSVTQSPNLPLIN